MPENALKDKSGYPSLLAENIHGQNTNATERSAADSGHGAIRLHADTATMAFGTVTRTVHPLFVHAIGGGTGAAADVNVSAFGGNAVTAGGFTTLTGTNSALLVSNIATAGGAPTTVTIGAFSRQNASTAAFVSSAAPAATDAALAVWAQQVGSPWGVSGTVGANVSGTVGIAGSTISIANFPTSFAVTNALSIGTNASVAASISNTPVFDLRSASSVTIQAGTIGAMTGAIATWGTRAATDFTSASGTSSAINCFQVNNPTAAVTISTPISIVGSTISVKGATSDSIVVSQGSSGTIAWPVSVSAGTMSVNVNTIGSLPGVTVTAGTLTAVMRGREYTNSTNLSDLSFRGASSSVAGTTTSIKALDVADLGAAQSQPTLFVWTRSTQARLVLPADPTRRAAIFYNIGAADVFLGGSGMTHASLATISTDANSTNSTGGGQTRGYPLTKSQNLFVPWTNEVWALPTAASTISLLVWTAS